MSGTGEGGGGTGWRRPPAAAEREELARSPGVPEGLCNDCLHLRLLRSGRSLFVRCLLADSNPAFRRYPPLPVRECDGHQGWRGSP